MSQTPTRKKPRRKRIEWNNATLTTVGVWAQAVFVLASVGMLAFQVRSDHRQRKLESTISFVVDASRAYRSVEYDLCGRESNGAIRTLTSESARAIELDDEKSIQARNLLAEFEWMAAGVSRGALDLEMVSKMRGGYFISFYKRWSPYMQYRIDQIEEINRKRSLYSEIEWLAMALADLRGQERPAALDRSGPKS